MKGPRAEDRLYPAGVLAFLCGLVAIGLLGVPALLVAAIGVAVAAVVIAVFHRKVDSRRRRRVPEKYVPQVLENGSLRRRRGVHLRRHRGASPPLRFR
jgi:Flp pilus assembly protein TadB